jgi:tripartite-type tricarboxylate transporter receptor subunit TctC
MQKRSLLALGGALCVVCSAPLFAASAFPTKMVRFVIPFPPGGGTDILGRPLAQKLSERWGQQVVVDNRGGAGGNVGTELVAKSPPDGYTIELGTNGTHTVNHSLYSNPPFNGVRDFAAVTMTATTPNVLVLHPSVQANSVKELIAFAKAHPGQINYASPGPGTPPHLAAEIFRTMAGVNLVHVPYKGAGPASVDLLGGHVQMMIANAPVVLPHIKAGKLRALGTTSVKRPAILPDIPTIAEAGLPGYEADTWYGIFAPAGTPRDIVQKLNTDIVQALFSKDLKELYAAQGAEVVGNSIEEFAAQVRTDSAKWAKVIKEIGVKVD